MKHTPDTTKADTHPIHTPLPESLKSVVNERGFALYKWISVEELGLSIRADYLSIIQRSSIPLAVVTLIAGFIGLSWGIPGVVLGVMIVLSIFYLIIFLILGFKMIHKAYLYTRGADVILTDNHYVIGGKIIEYKNFPGAKKAYEKMGEIFHEFLFEDSKIEEYITMQKQSLKSQFKTMARTGIEMLDRTKNSRENNTMALILVITGGLYTLMMGIVYFLGVFIVSMMARVTSWIAHQYLLITHNTEHVIQSNFQRIHTISETLEAEKNHSITLLSEAKAHAWMDNLSGRIHTVFKKLDHETRAAIERNITLRNTLEQSMYRDIFNFQKYDRWIKNTILVPIQEIITLLKEMDDTVTKTISALEEGAIKKPGDNFWGDTGQKALNMQKGRLEMQRENIQQMIATFALYEAKLSTKGPAES